MVAWILVDMLWVDGSCSSVVHHRPQRMGFCLSDCCMFGRATCTPLQQRFESLSGVLYAAIQAILLVCIYVCQLVLQCMAQRSTCQPVVLFRGLGWGVFVRTSKPQHGLSCAATSLTAAFVIVCSAMCCTASRLQDAGCLGAALVGGS